MSGSEGLTLPEGGLPEEAKRRRRGSERLAWDSAVGGLQGRPWGDWKTNPARLAMFLSPREQRPSPSLPGDPFSSSFRFFEDASTPGSIARFHGPTHGRWASLGLPSAGHVPGSQRDACLGLCFWLGRSKGSGILFGGKG